MKYTRLFLLLTMIFSLQSCDNEPLDNNIVDIDPTNNSLIGAWSLESFDMDLTTSTTFEGTPFESNVIIHSLDTDYSLTFDTNTFTAFGDYSYSTSIIVDGQSPITDTYSLENVSGNGAYSVNGNEITLDGALFEFEFNGMDLSDQQGIQVAVFQISDDGETLTLNQNTTETQTSNGISVVNTTISTSVWTKTQTTSCGTAENAATTAAAAYNNDTTNTSLCNAYKTALQNQINACGDVDGSIQTIIDGLGDCSTDNEPNEALEGTWKLTGWIGEEPIDLNNDGTESVNFLDEMDCYENETIVFNADNTAVAMSTSYASFIFDIETGTTNEYDYTIECEFENENTNMTWIQNGDTVTVDDGSAVSDFTLNGNQLSILIPEGFLAFSSDFTATTSQDLTFIYTKQ
jgi:hypothetical protein